jgi:hypothetical protein
MSYFYSEDEIEMMKMAGIISDPKDHSLSGKSFEIGLIEKNTKCPKCGGKVKVVKWMDPNGIECLECNHKFD